MLPYFKRWIAGSIGNQGRQPARTFNDVLVVCYCLFTLLSHRVNIN